MKYQCFHKWHRHYREPVGPLSVEEARDRDSAGVNYCVAVKGEARNYEAFIEVCRNYLRVSFLDDQGRVYLAYGFEDDGNGRLFLDQAYTSEYSPDDTHNPSIATTYYFKQTGATAIERGIRAMNRREVIDTHCDVDANWEVRPKFGDYETLLVKNRGIPAS